MDIIAGHTGTETISQKQGFHDVYYDGKSHYYIDGSILNGGRLPILVVDLEKSISGTRKRKNDMSFLSVY